MAQLAYTTIGHGPRASLLLHGFLGSGRNLGTLARRWSARDAGLRLWLVDLTGHGDSPPLSDSPSLAEVAGDVLATLRSAGGPRCCRVVGHSLGGRVALCAKALAPEVVEQVTLLDVGPGPVASLGGGLQPLLDAFLAAPEVATSRQELRDFFAARGVAAPLVEWVLRNAREGEDGSVRWRVRRASLAALHAAASAEDLWGCIDGRVGCIRGERSGFVDAASARRMAALGCRVDTLQGAGHFVHVDALDALLDLLCPQEPAIFSS